MKRTISVFLLLIGFGLVAAQSPKREMRAVWLTTAWQLDWPFTNVPAATGSNEEARQTAIAAQKNSLITIFDQLQSTNMNAVFFQVRSMCDALYNSTYEPWSHYVSSVRGADPGWDPLAFAIEEAQKRGMELHAWLNPYRYSTASASHGNLETDYAVAKPEWLIAYNDTTKILNPGIPEVTQRISDIVAEIVTKYDVDGIVFDDYFYVNGKTTNPMDQEQFDKYNPKGLVRADWRRANVNNMIKTVYDRIQTIKPYVTFGVGPAGLAKGGAMAAGVTAPSVSGSDWQYNGIYADPLAWLYEGSIDYISPQIYWSHTSSGNPYGPLSKWWSEVAAKFGKHFYSSQSFQSGTQVEMGNQINSNRTYDLNNAPGSVFFRTGQFTPVVVRDYLKANQFQLKALPPAIDWKSHPVYDNIGEGTLTGLSLAWNPVSGVPGGARYSIYAVPSSPTDPVADCTTSRYLLGMSYTNSYTIPLANAYGYNFVIGLLDRYGNEFLTGQTEPIDPTVLSVPKIFSPENLSIVGNPLIVEWYPVPAASGFTMEQSTSPDFTGATTTNIDAGVYQATITELTNNTTYYVRVRANDGASSPTAWSDPVQFTALTLPDIPVITSPISESLVPRFLTVSWGADSRATRGFTMQWSVNADFSGSPASTNVNAGVTQYTYSTTGSSALQVGQTYYVRVCARYDASSNTEWSEAVQFRVYNPTVERLLILGSIQGSPYGDHLPMPYSIEVGDKVFLGIRTGTNNGNSSDWDSRLSYDLTSSDTNVATIDEFGEVNGVGPGTTLIKAVRKAGTPIEGFITLTVTGEAVIPPGVLTLSLNESSIKVGETAELTIADENEDSVDVLDCALTSSNTKVATISSTGVITGVSPGTATITAARNYDNAKGTVDITIEDINNVIVPGADAIIIYGNAEEGVTVRFNGKADIELYTVTGLLIDKAKASQTYSRYLGKGVYIVAIHLDGQVFRSKLIIR